MTEDSEVQITLALKSLNESSNLLGLKILAGNATKKTASSQYFWQFDSCSWLEVQVQRRMKLNNDNNKNFLKPFSSCKMLDFRLSNLGEWLRYNFIVKWVHLLSFFLIWFPLYDNSILY